MKLPINYFLFLFCYVGLAQTPTTSENYIRTKTYKQPTGTAILTPSLQQAAQQVTYYDGLGRPMQQVAYGQSATGKDIVTPIAYDAYGRQVKNYLPYAKWYGNADMGYVAGAQNEVFAYYSTYSPQVTGNPSFEQTNFPFSEKQLEASPLDRVLAQGAPGNDWQVTGNHKIQFDYQTNSANEVIQYLANTSWNLPNLIYDINLVNNGYYNLNELYKTVTKDENWTATYPKAGTTEEFKDKEGHVILKRTYASYGANGTPYANTTDVPHDTYYVYDIYGNLTYVIPPLVTNASTDLNALCYQYKYDNRNRLVAKKLPGKAWEYIVYDKLDRVVATGPVFSPFTDQQATQTGTSPTVGWLITKYDVFNRPVYTGWQVESTAFSEALRGTKQSNVNSWTTINESKTTTATTIDAASVNYTNAVAPTTFKLLTINYYDDYSFPNAPTTFTGTDVFYNNSTNKPKGLPTGSWVRILESSTTNNYEKSYILYDAKARPILNKKQNYLGGYTQTFTKLDFTGKTIYTETNHQYNSTTTTALPVIREDFEYTDQDRLLKRTHKIGTGAVELINYNTYDELGQLVSKWVGGSPTAGLQKVDYSYNIRGWLTGINDINNLSSGSSTDPQDLFAFKINYNQVQNAPNYTGKPLYNGNIAETYWRTASDNEMRKYGYFYDELNRLKDAVYQRPQDNVVVTNNYNENLTYDKNGNIKTLFRNGNIEDPANTITIDNLSYTYTANQLTQVDDSSNSTSGFKNVAGVDYAYDLFGNLTKDGNKTITNITYNHLNLPTKITFTGTSKYIEYIYNALGQKVKKVVTNNTSINTTDYLDGFQYLKTGSTGTVKLQFFPNAEGYVTNTATTGFSFKYIYNYKDHLGNTRLSFAYGAVGLQPAQTYIMSENNYYPFGLQHSGYNIDLFALTGTKDSNIPLIVPVTPSYPLNKYKYNAKELQDELGLNVTAMDYRQYDNATGRFNTIDALSELDPNKSPYSFARNSPVALNDPTGFCPECEDYYESLGVEPYGGEIYMSKGGAEYTFDEIAGEWARTDLMNTLDEVIVTGYGFDTEKGNYDDRAGVDGYGDYEIDTENLNDIVNGIGIGTGIKSELWTYAIAQNYKSATNSWSFSNLRATQQAWRTTNTLGKLGSNMLTTTKALGTIAGVVQIGLKANEIYNKGVENATARDWADLGVNTAGVVAAVFFASNPIGWAVGAGALVYSIGTAIYDANNPQTTNP